MSITPPKELRDQIKRAGIKEVETDATGVLLAKNLKNFGRLDAKEAEKISKIFSQKRNLRDRDKELAKYSEEKFGRAWDYQKRQKIEHATIKDNEARKMLFEALKNTRTMDWKKSILTKMFKLKKDDRERLLRIFKNDRVVTKDRQALDTSSSVFNKFYNLGKKSVTVRSDFSTSHSLSTRDCGIGGNYSNVSALSSKVTNPNDLAQKPGGSASVVGPRNGQDPGFKSNSINNMISFGRG